MPAAQRWVLDSFALLAFLNRERGFEKVRRLLRAAAAEPLLMNEINIGEVYYITARGRSLEQAEEVLRRIETLPIRAVATAIREDAVLVTGGPELRSAAQLVRIDWL